MSKTISVFVVIIIAFVAAALALKFMPASWRDLGAVLAAFLVISVGLLAVTSKPQPYNDPKFWE